MDGVIEPFSGLLGRCKLCFVTYSQSHKSFFVSYPKIFLIFLFLRVKNVQTHIIAYNTSHKQAQKKVLLYVSLSQNSKLPLVIVYFKLSIELLIFKLILGNYNISEKMGFEIASVSIGTI